MTKTAFLFAGQGSQKPGMARDFYDQFAVAKEVFEEASQLLGYDLRHIIDHEADRLNQTVYTQPAVLTTSIAIYRVLESLGQKADMVAGLSLGEYSALVASGALDFADAIKLVAKRGRFMQEAAPVGFGKMVAVLNTDAVLIEEACDKASDLGVVSPANYNTPGQIVIGGESEAVNAALVYLKSKGSKHLIPLKVSGPFHTTLLKEASQRLAKELEQVTFKPFQIPLVGNTEAAIMSQEAIPSLLARQVMEPVRFYDSIDTLKNLGMTEVIEIGPGNVLAGFMKKIDKQIPCSTIDDVDSLQLYLEK
ncbi:ACP S-malonyltransferase [Streptococcus ictaluri]|uniref:Malonyl CoA-acyl carrier protein transacylase n=1 Tax=Streptococcus ictaluri 707-05 TaxID=764299 RepID=G5K035_9STRE|nr:ACP S-malonyltransferase [Streptococcus ictaluri]EHI70995.1 [acyl-carrier-protein] S-malonyltransferase [Streptococcus ictaluri 707-05]